MRMIAPFFLALLWGGLLMAASCEDKDFEAISKDDKQNQDQIESNDSVSTESTEETEETGRELTDEDVGDSESEEPSNEDVDNADDDAWTEEPTPKNATDTEDTNYVEFLENLPACKDTLNNHVISVLPENNYTFISSFEIDSLTVKDATDLKFDWSYMTVDLFGKPVNSLKDIDMVLLSLWATTPAELIEKINADNLPRELNKGALSAYPDGTYSQLNLLSFDSFGSKLDEELLWSFFDTSQENYAYPQDSHTFMVMVASGIDPGKDNRMMSFFTLDPDASSSVVIIDNGSSRLSYDVELVNVPPVQVPAKTTDLTLNWKAMVGGSNALGNEWRVAQITEVALVRFAEETMEDLEENFLYLEKFAENWWEAEVIAGENFDLTNFKIDSITGERFAGIDDTGIWILAAFCTSTCNNPAPWSITILEACN